MVMAKMYTYFQNHLVLYVNDVQLFVCFFKKKKVTVRFLERPK